MSYTLENTRPTKLKNFDAFHSKYGKYILQASA